jgi:hypothetical protein
MSQVSLSDTIRNFFNDYLTTPSVIVSPKQFATDISNNNIGNAVLAKQHDMQKIISNENTRLDIKQKSIDDALTSKERMIELNANYTKRKTQYQKMMIAIMIGLVIYFTVYIIDSILHIPDAIFFLILIITFVSVAIYCFNIYLIIVNRDPIDYDKLNISPPPTLSSSQIQTATNANANISAGNMNLLGDLNILTCLGSSCCSTGTIWDVSAQLCLKDKDTFIPVLKINLENLKITTQDDELNNFLKTNSSNFKIVNKKNGGSSSVFSPNVFSPSEFDGYSMYK